ncbi:MAG: ATP-binding cassette domain-containing protein [Clostridiales bacterium]|nr:ATP-binding cassette domain-containing protein [Clostridiales bacterium]
MENEQNFILRGENLHKEYVMQKNVFGKPVKKFVTLKGIDIGVKCGETLGLVGESGSGKSTTGEILGDLQKPTEGSVYYLGRKVSDMTKEEYKKYRKDIQFIFQDPKGSMNPKFTVYQVMKEPLVTLDVMPEGEEMDALIKDYISKVGLEEDILTESPSRLSGGQCQRIAIARALIVNPKVVICDEPVSALDVSVQAQILNLLRDLQKELKIAYVFISHDIGIVNYMADRIAVMYLGEIVESGTADEVFGNPKDSYTKRLVDCALV